MKHILSALILSVFLLGQTGVSNAASPADPQSAGVIVVSAPSGPDVMTTSNVWNDIPQMKTRFVMPVSGPLLVTFCAEADTTGGRMFLSITDNGEAAFSPGDVVFVDGITGSTHCFTFVQSDALAGFHVLRAQWKVDSTGYMGDRTMTITFSSPEAEELRLLGIAAPSGATLNLPVAWTDIPDLAGTIDLPYASDLAITISAEAFSDGVGLFTFTRALVDNQVASASDSMIANSGFTGVRAYTYILKNVPAGTHTVHVESKCGTADKCHLADRTLTVVANRLGDVRRVVGAFIPAPSGLQQSTTSTSWTDIPDAAGDFFSPAEIDLAIQFTAEIYASPSTRIFVRALVDGQPGHASDVVFETGGLTGSQAFTFVIHNLGRGSHTLQMQWLVDSGNGSIGDHSTAAWGFASQHSLLVVGMESNRGQPDYPFGGLFPSSVVDDTGGQRVFKDYVRQRLFGASPSQAGYFLENSFGNYYVVDGGLRGPYLKQYDESFYRNNIPDPFTTMQLEALQKVDQDNYDFALYDRNGDGIITSKELVTLVVFYQDTCDGFVRTIPNYATNDGVVLNNSVFPHVYLPDFSSPTQVGLIAHELSHVFINTGDMYESTWDPSAPGPYSLMDQHTNHPDLDPWHKLNAQSWYDATQIPQDGYVLLKEIESSGQILKLADSSHPGEYFLVENRQKVGYDTLLPDTGLAIWHINENIADVPRDGVMIEPASGPTNPIQWNQYLYDGSGQLWGKDFWWGSSGSNSRWVNGTDSQIGVWAIPPSQNEMFVYIDVPGPGILVDFQVDAISLSPGSSKTYQVRLVNTGPAADTFALSCSLNPSWVQWSQNLVTLSSYEQKIITLTITIPEGAPVGQMAFTITGTGATAPHPSTTHPEISLDIVKNTVLLPLIMR